MPLICVFDLLRLFGVVVVAADDDDVIGVAVTEAVVDVGEAAGGSTVDGSGFTFFSSLLMSPVWLAGPLIAGDDDLAAALAQCVEQYGFFLSRFFGSVLPQWSHPMSDLSGDDKRRFTARKESKFKYRLVI